MIFNGFVYPQLIAYKNNVVHKLTLSGLCLFPTFRLSRSDDASFSKFTCLSFHKLYKHFYRCFYLADAVAMATKLFAKTDINYFIFRVSSSKLF